MTPADVKRIRRNAGLSISQLAALLRISDARTIRRWEGGQTPVSGPASIVLELMDSGELPSRVYGEEEEEINVDGGRWAWAKATQDGVRIEWYPLPYEYDKYDPNEGEAD